MLIWVIPCALSLSVQLAGLGWGREHGWNTAGKHQQPAKEETSLAPTGHSHGSDVARWATHFCPGAPSRWMPFSVFGTSIIYVVACVHTFPSHPFPCSRWRGRGSCVVSACRWRRRTSSLRPVTCLTPGGLYYNVSHPSRRPLRGKGSYNFSCALTYIWLILSTPATSQA